MIPPATVQQPVQSAPVNEQTRKELFAEAKKMGLKVLPNWSNDQIKEELKKQFA
jgi:uncharacterized protein (DUF302 family)